MSFGNASLAVHLLRGLLGLSALLATAFGYEHLGWPALLCLPVALWALKGCPVCWTIGLFETLAFKILRAEDAGAGGDREPATPSPACARRQTK